MGKTTTNKCGECTLCCYLLPVPTLDKKATVLCDNCALNKGCIIYANRPTECAKFECAYIQMDNVHTDLRPDNCKVIFEKISGTVFLGTQDPRFEMTDVARKQIHSFNNQGFSVIIMIPDKKIDTYLAKNHTEKQVKKDVKKHLEERNDRS